LSKIFHIQDVRAQFFVSIIISILPLIAIVRIVVWITRRTNVEIGCLTVDLLHKTGCASRRARDIVKVILMNVDFLFFFNLLMLN
jgi:hypothetical protein